MSALLKHKSLSAGMLEKMFEVRFFEEQVEAFFKQGMIRGSVHLYIGEEAVAVGACSALEKSDYITSTHRGHGHFIAKGGDCNRMMAEILGRETGYCRGKGGSMHVTDIEIGNLGANGIVGAGIPIATGAAMALKLQRQARVVVCFFGDGAANTGAFHEGINLASIHSLPVVFICENNCYAISASTCNTFCIPNISERARSYGIPGISVDGMDVVKVHQAAVDAVNRAREGAGPTFIECKTYRFKGHFVGDAEIYRTREELATWMQKDPIQRFSTWLVENGVLDKNEIHQLRTAASDRVKQAERFALQSSEPAAEEACQSIYA
jgi:TPP-dependent pyruvate/acetoin dehydrogenase alpha subunit